LSKCDCSVITTLEAPQRKAVIEGSAATPEPISMTVLPFQIFGFEAINSPRK